MEAFTLDAPADTAPDAGGTGASTLPPRVPIAGPVTHGGVTLAVCTRGGTDAPALCRATGTGTYRPTGRVIDIARALTAGLLVAPDA